MVENDAVITVKNRGGSVVGYRLPESGVRRSFQPKESKQITMGELRQLSYQPGG